MHYLIVTLSIIFQLAGLITELNYWWAFVKVTGDFLGWFGCIVGPILLLISSFVPFLPSLAKAALPWINSSIYGEPINWFSFLNIAWIISMLNFLMLCLGLPIAATGLMAFETIKGLFSKKND